VMTMDAASISEEPPATRQPRKPIKSRGNSDVIIEKQNKVKVPQKNNSYPRRARRSITSPQKAREKVRGPRNVQIPESRGQTA
jgi:hypothetical protein